MRNSISFILLEKASEISSIIFGRVIFFFLFYFSEIEENASITLQKKSLD